MKTHERITAVCITKRESVMIICRSEDMIT